MDFSKTMRVELSIPLIISTKISQKTVGEIIVNGDIVENIYKI